LSNYIATTYQSIKLAGLVSPSVYDRIGMSQSELDRIYNNYIDYTDGYILATTWSWPST